MRVGAGRVDADLHRDRAVVMLLPLPIPPTDQPAIDAIKNFTQPWLRYFLALFRFLGGMGPRTYAPTAVAVTNVTSATASECQWLQVGTSVTVSGVVTVDPTSAGAVSVGIPLPVPSSFTTTAQCAGTAACPTIAGQCAAVLADTTNDRASMQWIAVDTTSQPMVFTFTYQVVA